MLEFIHAPRAGEVYNLGGGPERDASLLECVDDIIDQILAKELRGSTTVSWEVPAVASMGYSAR